MWGKEGQAVWRDIMIGFGENEGHVDVKILGADRVIVYLGAKRVELPERTMVTESTAIAFDTLADAKRVLAELQAGIEQVEQQMMEERAEREEWLRGRTSA